MKKVLLGVLFGFLLNTGLNSYYSYRWWSIATTLTNQQMNESIAAHGYFKIVEDNMGFTRYLKYVLAKPQYIYKNWILYYP